MRPQYEDEQSLIEERKACSFLAQRWGASWQKLPKAYRVDYALLKDDKVVCWLEIKRRYNPIGLYPTLAISLHKIMDGVDLQRHTSLPVVLAVQWDDCLGHIRLDSWTQYSVAFGGRSDRPDWQDREPMAHFPTGHFKIIPNMA